MKMCGGVLLNDEDAIAALMTFVTCRFGGFFEVALLFIFVQHRRFALRTVLVLIRTRRKTNAT